MNKQPKEAVFCTGESASLPGRRAPPVPVPNLPAMHTLQPKSLRWPHVLAALRTCTGASVLVRDGRVTEPAGAVRSRPSARGSELCLFPGDRPAARLELIRGIEAIATGAGRRFAAAARANVNGSYLLVDGVRDETIDGALFTVINTRRPVLGYNQSQQTGGRTTLRSKRIKTG